MDVSNEQTLNPVTLVATNGGSIRRQGVEVDWRAPLVAATTISGNWTFTDARYRSLVAAPEDGGGDAVVLNGLRVYNTASYVGVAALQLAPTAASWRIRASGNWVGPYSPFDEPGVLIGGYGLMHLSGTVPVAGVELDAGVRNVFDRAYPEMIAGHIVSPGEPRTIFFSARVRM
jgi:outer membrane receptor protein involved in Fe transport